MRRVKGTLTAEARICVAKSSRRDHFAACSARALPRISLNRYMSRQSLAHSPGAAGKYRYTKYISTACARRYRPHIPFQRRSSLIIKTAVRERPMVTADTFTCR